MNFMIFYLTVLLTLAAIFIGFFIWIYRLFKFYKKGNRKSFWIQCSILVLIVVFITWNFRVFPLSKNFYIKKQTELLTGKKFWSWEVYTYDEMGFRGEGYTIEIFEFDDEVAEYFMNPNADFFEKYPLELEYRENWTRNTWKKTPVIESEVQYLEHATPRKGEIIQQINFVKDLAKKEGSFYAYNTGGDIDFFIISPSEKLIIMINHNM